MMDKPVVGTNMRSLVTLRRRGTDATAGLAHRGSECKGTKQLNIPNRELSRSALIAASKLTSTINTVEAPVLGPPMNITASINDLKDMAPCQSIYAK